jgi:hypothetical protein
MGEFGGLHLKDALIYSHLRNLKMMKLSLPQVSEWVPKPPILKWIVLLAALGLTLDLATSYLKNQKTPPSTPEAVIAQVNPVVKNEEKVEVALETPKKTLRVYPQEAKKKLSLPSETLSNAKIHLTDSSVIKSTERSLAVSQLLDTTTGETKTYVTTIPTPWFALEHRGYAAVDYGYKRNSSNPVLRLNVREDLVQIKGIHLGITGSLHSDGDYFVGAGGEYRW